MWRRARVLIVDDYRENAEAIASCVKMLGHESHIALDARTALDASTGFCPDVGIIDLRLPGENGFALAHGLRERFTKMFLVLITGFSRPDLPRRAREAGFDRYVLKPIGFDCIRSLMDDATRA